MLKIKRDGWNGQKQDCYRPRKRRVPAKQWNSLIEREYADAPRVEVLGVSCGIRRTFEADRPFRLIQPKEGGGFTLLDVWAQSDGTLHVRQQMSKEVIAILVETDEGLAPISLCQAEKAPLTPYEEAAARHHAIDALLALPLPVDERARVIEERKSVQRQMSRASFEELYLVGLKAFRDGNCNSALVGRVVKVIALERHSLRDGLTASQKSLVENKLLPDARRAVAAYVKYCQRSGKEL
jgi:hypothetical protein